MCRDFLRYDVLIQGVEPEVARWRASCSCRPIIRTATILSALALGQDLRPPLLFPRSHILPTLALVTLRRAPSPHIAAPGSSARV